VQLYDLANDIGERRNLAASEPARLKSIRELARKLTGRDSR
jgi:hypothetical protein